METPFIFGKIAIKQNFTNRNSEADHLIINFNSLVNTILISPRRWGKSSLVLSATEQAKKQNKQLRFCYLDIYNIRSEEQFYQALAEEVLRASASKMSALMQNAKTFMGQFLPRLTFSPDNETNFKLSLDWKEVIKHPDDILDMAEKIATAKKLKFIVCIDEFQNISEFDHPLAFQKKLRSHWQQHQNTAYCLYGSKRHMLIDVFTNASMPFYKFGDVLFLEKIKKEEWIPFIIKRFNSTSKKIHKKEAQLIADLVECHPYYVQQLAQQSWLRTHELCTEAVVREAHQSIVYQLSLLFQSKTDELSTPQINFLKALLSGEKKLSSKRILQTYNLGTSANVLRIKQALINKEIIDIQNQKIEILDPIYRSWLENLYFKLKK